MSWWSTKSIIIILLFFGVLLLIAGYFYFGYSKTEGFQATPTVSTCDTGTNRQKCDIKCLPTDPLPPATSDEDTAYGVYEAHNLIDSKLNAPPVVLPTILKQFNSGGALTPFDHDPKLPIPWDFDNQTLNPATSMFGTVCATASQLIFAKCECQTLYGDINNLSYDADGGLFSYESQLFGSRIYDQREAAALQFAEMFINLEMGKLMGEAFGEAGAMPNRVVNNKLNFMKEAKFKLQAQISDFKSALITHGGDELAALRVVRTNTQNGTYDNQWHKYSGATSQIPMSIMDNTPGVDALKRGAFKFGRKSVVKSPLGIDFSNPDEAIVKLKTYIEARKGADVIAQQKLVDGKGRTVSEAYTKYMGLRRIIQEQNREAKNTSNGAKRTVFQRISDLIPYGRSVQSSAALKSNSETTIKLAKHAITAAEVNIAWNTLVGIINGILAGGAVGGRAEVVAAATFFDTIIIAIKILMQVVQLALMTFVPALFSSFLESDAKCPLNPDGSPMFNLNDYFDGASEGSKFPYGEPWGSILIALLQNLPEFGPYLMAFGPYVCFPDTDAVTRNNGVVELKFKNNLRSPPYYYDPTLSIYNAGNKPRFQAGYQVGGPMLDQRLFNPFTFHYNKDIRYPKDAAGNIGYPVWVDFANPIMLNKMAQFYYDASRKCPSTTRDGMLSFQYISNFKGLISTTELTCDVQCEITEVTFDPESGRKLCEVIVPIDTTTLTTSFHDRRFYFYKDMGRSVMDRTAQIPASNLDGLRALMEDNMNIYIVTGCTNVDGSAPDCMTYDSEGNSTENPVISLGNPGAQYTSPMVDVYSMATRGTDGHWNLPQQSSCDQVHNFTRYNGISHPAATGNDATNDRVAPIADNPVSDEWKYAYKDEHQEYWYPSNNVAAQVGTAVKASAGETLKTTKYWSIVWNQVCRYEDADCQINSKQGRGRIIQGTMEGLIGAGFGIGQVHAGYQIAGGGRPGVTSPRFDAAANIVPLVGGVAQTLMAVQFPGQSQSISQAISCLYEEFTDQYGTYIMNGRIMTSQQGFVVDQGPFIKWAPGYRPIIQFCSKQTIELYDCVNTYAVRRFVSIYHTQHRDKQIKKIHSINPSLSTGTNWDVNNSIAMCVYNMDVANFNYAAFKEIPSTITNINVGLFLQQNVADKTCTFVPRCMPNYTVNPPINVAYKNNTNPKWLAEVDADIYQPQVFSRHADEPVWPINPNTRKTSLLSITANKDQLLASLSTVRSGSSAVQAIAGATGVSATNLPPTVLPVLDTIVGSPKPIYNCSNSTIQSTLIGKFNDAHDGIPNLIAVTEALSMSTIGGQNLCLFKAKFGSVPDPVNLLSTINIENTIAQAVERNLTISLDISGRYVLDDYPIHMTYTPIPKASNWLDVPPRTLVQVASGNFARTGCSTDTVFNDCSNSALIDILMTQYNQGNVDSKILKVWRSFTPNIPSSKVCDYDVERLKTLTGGASVLDRETMRFFLTNDSRSTCGYNLDLTNTNIAAATINGGVSLNRSPTLGMLVTPFITAVRYSTDVQTSFFSTLQSYIGYNIPDVLNKTTTAMLTAAQSLRQTLYRDNTLYNCPTKTCMDDTIITSMINRYNFDNYPPYPPTKNTVLKNTIIRVTKAGTPTPTECQLEIYLRTDFFTDFLYSPLPQDVQFYLHDYVFKLLSTPTKCKFTVKPFTRYDISYNTMDISGDAFTLECPPAPARCPSVITASSAASMSWANTDYIETMIHCDINTATDPILMLVKAMYNSTVIFTRNGTNYYNTINSVTKVFNATPNILEFKITTKRVYWDSNYNQPYYTGTTKDDIEEAFIVVTWAEGTAYEVETGYFWKNVAGNFIATPAASSISIVSGVAKSGSSTMCSPTIQEFFFPDLTFRADSIIKTNLDGSTTQVVLPYLANDGITPVDPRQRKMYVCNPTTCVNSDGSAV